MIKTEKLTTEKFQELVEKSLWWKEISDEIDRVHHVQSFDVPIEHKVVAIHALFENEFITDEKIKKAKEDSVFQEAYELLAKMKVGDSFPEKVYELSKAKLSTAKRTISKVFLEIISIFSETISQEKAEDIWKNDKEKFYTTSFDELSKFLQLKTTTDRYILRCLESLTY